MSNFKSRVKSFIKKNKTIESTYTQLNPKHKQWFMTLKNMTRMASKRAHWLSFFSNSLAIMSTVFVLQVYDKVIFHKNLDTLTGLLFGMLIVIVFEFTFRYVRARILRGIAIQCDVHATSALFHKIFAIPIRELETRSSAVWNSLFFDIERVRNRFSGPLAVGFMDFPFAIVMLILLYFLAAPVFLVPVFFILVLLIIIWRADKILQHAIANEQKQVHHRSAKLADLISVRETIKAMQMQSSAYNIWAKSQSDVINMSLARGTEHDFYEGLGNSIVLLASVIIVSVGAIAIINNEMSMGALIAANMLAGRAMGTSARMISLSKMYRESIEAEKRVDSIFAIHNESQKSVMPIFDWKGDIKLEKASFQYSKNLQPVLKEASGVFKSGSFYGVIGPNGGGKSTLIKIMRGIYSASSGRVFCGNSDIRQFTQKELASKIGYLSQEPGLISTSIYNNLTFGLNNNVKSEVVQQACKDADCLNYISNLPEGFNSLLGSNTLILTPGIKQKIALARLYIRNPNAILLDEPTNHLDEQALSKLKEYLINKAKDSLVVVVSHNIELLKASNIIIYISEGKIIRSGPTKLMLTSLQA